MLVVELVLYTHHTGMASPAKAKPSIAEEDAFMEQLLNDSPAPVTPPRRHSARKITSTPKYHLYSAGKVDLEEEVTGWDWGALSDYIPTPERPCNSLKKATPVRGELDITLQTQIAPNCTPDPCTRCLVKTVEESWNNGVREKVRTPLSTKRTIVEW